VSENAGGWPPGPRGPQDPRSWPGSSPPSHDPRVVRDPRLLQRPLPGQDGQPPEDRLGPSGYEPLHHEPRYEGPRPDRGWPDDSPWRRTQRLSGPRADGWPSGPPVNASYGEDPRGPAGDDLGGRYSDQRRYDGGGEYDDEYGPVDRFLPGFGDTDEAEDQDGRAAHGRRGKGRRQTARTGGPRRRRFRWIAPMIAILVILIPLAVGGVYAFNLYMGKYHPADYSGAGTGHVVVQVTSDETPTGLGPALTKLGVVASSRAFVLAAEHSSNPNGLLPGFYGVRTHMKASLAYAALLNPNNLVQIKVTIPEGWRLSQTLAWLGAHSGISPAAYAKVLKDPASLDLPASAKGNPEGYLFPATYEVQPHETALGVLTAMVQRFDQEAATINLPAAAKSVHLTQAQVITMASLVQAEGGRLSDYPKIARVIYNRLAQGMPLQLDSTVLYGLNRYGIIASDQQLTSSSHYNTYKYKGLTPGPIDSPGQAAIQAVLHPASGNWVYFVTVNPKTGETLYTSSPQQFQQFRQELEKNLGQG
jgi:UPF0755 protein